jgi:hypothetical protein
MWEEGIAFEGDDGNEDTDRFRPTCGPRRGESLDGGFAEALKAGVPR